MLRLYFLLPDTETAKLVVQDLLDARIVERQIHAIGKDHHLDQKHHFSKAGFLLEDDVKPAIEKGLAAGGITGFVAGLVAVAFPPAGLVLGGGAILASSLGGAAFGALVAPMIGVSAQNTRLKHYEDALEAGEYLIMVDVPDADMESISNLIRTRYPKVNVEVTEVNAPTVT